MKIQINKTMLNVLDTGDPKATPVVLVHGFPLSHEVWKSQIESLKPDHRAITYDVRGHGESEVGDGQYTMEFFVDDLIGVMDHLKVKRAVLCGLSMGGYIALRALERNPERFLALILCDSKSEADSNEAKLKRAATIKLIKEQGMETFADGQIGSALTPKTLQSDPAGVGAVRRIILHNSPIGMCGALLAMAGRTDTTASLPRVRVPTIVLVGEHDAITPPSLSKAMSEAIPNSTLQVIPGAAHWSNIDNSGEFNKQVISFLSQKTIRVGA